MSSKYEREIEEILRKIDDRQPTVSDRIRAINQRPTRLRRTPSIRISYETGLVVGVLLTIVAATMRWILQFPTTNQEWIIGGMALASAILIIVSLILAWIGGNSAPNAAWRGQSLDQGGRGPRRTPFSYLRTRMNLIKLKMGYRRR